MASLSPLSSIFRSSATRSFSRVRKPIPTLAASPRLWRTVSTKHPAGFEPPTDEDLLELRDRVQEFARELTMSLVNTVSAIAHKCHGSGREIPGEVAARTDEQNEFPADMWKKLGDAGYELRCNSHILIIRLNSINRSNQPGS